jgi:hypothetical protein
VIYAIVTPTACLCLLHHRSRDFKLPEISHECTCISTITGLNCINISKEPLSRQRPGQNHIALKIYFKKIIWLPPPTKRNNPLFKKYFSCALVGGRAFAFTPHFLKPQFIFKKNNFINCFKKLRGTGSIPGRAG